MAFVFRIKNLKQYSNMSLNREKRLFLALLPLWRLPIPFSALQWRKKGRAEDFRIGVALFFFSATPIFDFLVWRCGNSGLQIMPKELENRP